jgi:hypothetical protein
MTDCNRRQSMGVAARAFVAEHFSTRGIAEEFLHSLTAGQLASSPSRVKSAVPLA